jgi:hypothetical protein
MKSILLIVEMVLLFCHSGRTLPSSSTGSSLLLHRTITTLSLNRIFIDLNETQSTPDGNLRVRFTNDDYRYKHIDKVLIILPN